MGEDEKNMLNDNDSPKKHGYSAKRWIISVSFLLFLFNIWKFLNTPDQKFLFCLYYLI